MGPAQCSAAILLNKIARPNRAEGVKSGVLINARAAIQDGMLGSSADHAVACCHSPVAACGRMWKEE